MEEKKRRRIIRTVRHKIHDGKGGSREVTLTPMKAIRYFCNECMCGSSEEIRKCTAPLCPLYPFRGGLGKEPDIIFPSVVCESIK